MSGLDVIGGISAVIAIIDGSIKVWKSAKKDIRLSKTFEIVANRLPILQDTLRNYQKHFESVKATIPGDATKGLLRTIESCTDNARRLHIIFEETMAGQDDDRYERYKKVARRLGKGSEVEELMKAITEDVQNLVNHHMLKSGGEDLAAKLDEIIAAIKAIEPPSLVKTYAYSSLHPVATYVKRPTLEKQLQDQLPLNQSMDRGETRTVVVWGLGGSGKSQLVLKYVQEHRQKYRGIFWLEAGQKETIERDYVQICKQLYPDMASSSATAPIDVEDAIARVKNWLEQQPHRYLWVMDSADAIEDDESDDYIDLDHYLPDTAQLDRIVTTRSSQAQSMSSQDAVMVAELDSTEAVELFKKCARLKKMDHEVEQEVVAIIQELGCLALAITLAGSYVSETPRLSSNLKLYLPEYQAHRQRLLSRKARRSIHRYNESVLSTWEMSFKMVERRSPIAAKLLTFLAFLNFDDISLRLFEAARPSAPTVEVYHTSKASDWKRYWWADFLSPDGTDIDLYMIEEGFATLQAYSLVTWREEQETYAMHKLVHAWSHDRLESVQRQQYSLAVLDFLRWAAMSNRSGPVNKFDMVLQVKDRRMSAQMVPHVMANFKVLSAACGLTYEFEAWQQDALHTLMDLLFELRQMNDAYKICTTLCRATERTFGKVNHTYLTTHRALFYILFRAGRYAQAEAIARQNLVLAQIVPDQRHDETTLYMQHLASSLTRRGKYSQAEETLRQGLDLADKKLGSDHRYTLTIRDDLAELMALQGRYTEAESLSRQTTEAMKKLFGLDDRLTLASMNNLSIILHQQGKYEQAESMKRQILEVRIKAWGQDHPDTLQTMSNLANSLERQRKFKQAENIQRQVMALYKNTLDPDHPYPLANTLALATTLRAQGLNEEAESLSQQVFESKQRTQGLENRETLWAMTVYAGALQEQGKYEKAESLHRQNLEIRKRLQWLDSAAAYETMASLAQLLYEVERIEGAEEAEELARAAVDGRRRLQGPTHPETLPVTRLLAEMLYSKGEEQEYQTVTQQILQTLKKEDLETPVQMNNLAMSMFRQKRYKEAIDLLDQTIHLATGVNGQDHPELQLFANNITVVRGEYEEVKRENELDTDRARCSNTS